MKLSLNKKINEITEIIINRSYKSRSEYLLEIKKAKSKKPRKDLLSCGNLAHTTAGCSPNQKLDIKSGLKPNIAIISAYNDMLSAHQPYGKYPEIIKNEIAKSGGTCQFAGGVPAMCDGITQGQVGMELSLFSRDVIAQSSAVALSHNVFDSVLMLGVCDKIVPGLLMGALAFGHLPTIFVPAGPMKTGLSNEEKSRVRNLFAKGDISKEALLESEMKSYHSPGTCTFYGTANTNQLILEIMGLLIPGSAFVNPNGLLRDELTRSAAKRSVEISLYSKDVRSIGELINEKAIVNGIIGLLASGGSTNLTIHLIAIARMAGIIITWDDFKLISKIIPLIAKIYPNGNADVNDFHNAGGTEFVISELIKNGLLHKDIITISKGGMLDYTKKPVLDKEIIKWKKIPSISKDNKILRQVSNPFDKEGGITVVSGNIGRGIIKISAVPEKYRYIKAPAKVFSSQDEVKKAFENRELNRNFVLVVKNQGPTSNGMPELHGLTPTLSVLQNLGYKVALITDGRMSGASGKVLSVVHISPEAGENTPISKILDNDIIEINANKGFMNLKISKEIFNKRLVHPIDLKNYKTGYGRQLFNSFRENVSSAELGAISFL